MNRQIDGLLADEAITPLCLMETIYEGLAFVSRESAEVERRHGAAW